MLFHEIWLVRRVALTRRVRAEVGEAQREREGESARGEWVKREGERDGENGDG